eukprot:TRINITY_DN6252_c0_g1_i1.p1 TRINITY_DN6252_c0_g1~~TRINITY_DN6252_c0_g1_i1.p1  ORF type:complete len:291 (+),score=38.79 TRINITY_DN6252_c0_g1_i1:36-908(+)
MDLLDPTLPIQRRIRALHVIKDAIHQSDDVARAAYLEQLIAAFPTTDSVLLKHEIAFTMGQTRNLAALPSLVRWLHDDQEHVVTRHECAEAIGAIGDPTAACELERYRDAGPTELRETAAVALRRLEWLKSGGEAVSGKFTTVDPAPPAELQSVEHLSAVLLNEKLDLYERYRAMFALRDLSTEASVAALCKGFGTRGSALFRHEIAYVLGQLENPTSVVPLMQCLRDPEEHPMVRHEAAEALGGMGREECLEVLRQFEADKEPLVSESCTVGLDMHEYWSKWHPDSRGP